MKNRWMKTMALLLGGASLMVGVVGCEKDEKVPEPEKFPIYTRVGLPGELGGIKSPDQSITHPVEGAVITLYKTEQDYVLRQNPLETKLADAAGKAEFW